MGFRKTLLLTVAVGICIISLVIARNSAIQLAMAGFTQLWILPSQEMNQDIIRVGIYNMETPKSSFRLVVTADDRVIHEWPLIEVERDQPWEYSIVLSESYLSSSKVTATLYLTNNPQEPYRHVELFRDQ
jgi:hypothetical protein